MREKEVHLIAIKVFPIQLKSLNDAIISIFENDENAFETVNQKIKNDKRMGSRDRRQFSERIYHLVRWWNLICHIATNQSSDNNLRYGEMIFISFWLEGKIPQNDLLKEFEKNISSYGKKLNTAPPYILNALPEWIYNLGKSQYKDEWTAIVAALNEPANIILRANSHKCDVQKLMLLLKADGIETIHLGHEALSVVRGKNLRNHPLYKKGFFEFQDYHSQLVGHFISPKKFETVVDFCAGAGGKSIHLSNLMANTGKIYATDSSLDRMQDMPRRLKRSGSHNVEIVEKQSLLTKGPIADIVMLDLPCSGLGTLKRKPDIKWKITEQKLEDIIFLQKEILKEAVPLLKPSGSLFIVTCSILKNESEDQTQWFLSEFPAFKLESEKRLHPHIGGFDGFYMAKIRFHS